MRVLRKCAENGFWRVRHFGGLLIEYFAKNWKFRKKLKISQKIENFAKNWKFRKKLKISQKIENFEKKRNFGKILKRKEILAKNRKFWKKKEFFGKK